MSASLLHVSVSPRGPRSRSQQVGDSFVAAWRAAHSQAPVVTRDLAAEPPSFITSAWFEGAFTPAEHQSPAARTAMAESDHNIEQLLAASELLITTPMFNLGIPAILKAWIDHVVRVGRTFAIGPEGYQGLVPDRRVTVIVATGGDFRPESPAFGANFVESYLRAVLGFIGLHSVAFIYAPNQNMGAEAAEAGLQSAHLAAHQRAAA